VNDRDFSVENWVVVRDHHSGRFYQFETKKDAETCREALQKLSWEYRSACVKRKPKGA